jgi:6-phosphogluconolactonase
MAPQIQHATRSLATGAALAPRVVVRYSDEEAVAYAAANRIILTIADILATPGHDRADIAVTGGGDGIHVLEVMGVNPLLESVDWSRVHFWWGDERFVPSDDDDRNAKQAREGLLDSLVSRGLLPEANIHEMPADTRSAREREAASDEDDQAAADASAALYQEELVANLGQNPRLDIALFGVGPDGHFASLFPGHEEVKIVDARLACGVINSPKPPSLRVSLTVPMIQRSHHVWVIASSERKQNAITAALGTVNDPMVPVSHAAGTDSTVWMVDRVAAPEA